MVKVDESEGVETEPHCQPHLALPEPLILQHKLLQHPIEVPLGPGRTGPIGSWCCRKAGVAGLRFYPHLLPAPRKLIPLVCASSS